MFIDVIREKEDFQMAEWKRLTVDDLRLTLAEDEIQKLETRSVN